ncbi:MAG: glycoside hydrolase family 2 TIM barrel-domain containing protein [Pseudomonadota bacterium]
MRKLAAMLPLPLSQILDPTLTGLGRLPARSTLEPVQSDAERRQSLDGVWRFQLIERPAAAPTDWTTQATAEEPWRDIVVPGVWTRQDTGDFPHYANVRMPFACSKPPDIPENNPTGLYRTVFKVMEAKKEQQTVLHIGGFESLAMVWCNGAFIGLAKDSRLPSEFDLSSAVRAGANDLAIMVLRWCDATWIEDQDHWNHGGLHRSVWIETRGQTHIRDLVVDTDFDPTSGAGDARVRVEVLGPSEGHAVRASLADEAGATVCEAQCVSVDQFNVDGSPVEQWKQTYAFDGYAAKLSFQVADAAAWSAERPSRYRLVTELLDPDGACLERHETWIGFTRIETAGRRLSVNGRPIVLIGVNRHDHHPENGKTCAREDIRAELLTMKRHNINAIRTAHYPNDPALLDLADELGFYVIDEANVECHARWSEVAQQPGFQTAIVERTTRMIARDRNHPCVIGWSTGNEAGHGPAHDAAAAAARHLDPSRFVHYEGAVAMRFSFPFGKAPDTTLRAPSQQELAGTDIVCPMYTPLSDMVEWARWAEKTQEDDRPFLLCEFSHAMGNSNGSIAAYVDAFFEEPALAGGFVWDWRDQGLAETDDAGNYYWAYGGHFGDEPNDANFNINGLVGPDGAPHPALREYMWAARPVVSEWLGENKIRCTNRRVFEDTRDLQLTWQLLSDGVCVDEGRRSPIIKSGESQDIVLPITHALEGGGVWHLTVSWVSAAPTEWAEKARAMAWDQFTLSDAAQTVPAVLSEPAAVPLSFDSGQMLADGAPIFASSITPCVWRAPTDNDGGKPGARPLFLNKTREWVGYGLNALVPDERRVDAISGDTIKTKQSWEGTGGHKLIHQSTYTIGQNQIAVEETIIIPEAWKDVPRVGIRFEIDRGFDRLQWFGLGPDESYPDRFGAQTVGLWDSSVDDQYHPYVRPQEYGAHEKCRWFSLKDQAGRGIRVTLPEPLSFTARPHHDAVLNEAETLAELTPNETTEIHIDAAMRGLGTAACGPDALPQFLIGPGTYVFRWIVQAS